MGFDLLEYVKKSNYENTALIAPAGYGKTQFLLKCFEALKSENGVVPCYIDAAALNTKDLYTELQKYFFKDEKSYLGSIEFFKRFYNMVSAQSEIKYVLLINHYEDAFNNESIADVINIIENFVKMGCCVIVSSAFNDGKVFENFKVLKLEPHSKEKIISILEDKFKDSPKFDFKNLKEQVYSIISTPLMLGWYIELIKTNTANDVMINSEHQLMDRRFNEVLDNDFVLKTAYYCAEHKTKYITEKELVELLLAHNGKVRLVSRIFGKKHINDFEADVLMLEKYGIAKYEKSSQKLVFSNQICIDYFTAKKIGRDVNNNNFDVFDELIFSEQICKFLSYEIDKSSLLAELNSLRANQSCNVNRCFESCDDIVKITNLVNILYFYKNSFKDCDLHSLDLRLCNFIGRECVNTDFSNSLCNDACFVPLESETPNFFAISENGKYFATGNKSAVNIWDVKYSTVIHRVLSDESSPFTDIGYKKDTGFVISANSELYSSVIVKIKNGIISQSLNYDKNIVSSCIEKSKKDFVDKFDSYGALCCKQENFALLRSDENSYYGNAYLLFDVENEKLLSVCKVNTHLKISDAVQDGNEIEFLIKNDGKPLRSICFNDSTKEIYRKNYTSLVGKIYKKNNFSVYFDTENYDSFMKWYFYDKELLKMNFCKKNSKISNCKAYYFENSDEIINRMKRFVIGTEYKPFLFSKEKVVSSSDSITYRFLGTTANYTSPEYMLAENVDGENILINTKDNSRDIAFNLLYDLIFSKFKVVLSTSSVNIVNCNSQYYLAVSNHLFKILFENNCIRFEKILCSKLEFNSDFLKIIESTDWKCIIENLLNYFAQNNPLQRSVLESNIVLHEVRRNVQSDNEVWLHTLSYIISSFVNDKIFDKTYTYECLSIFDNSYIINYLTNFCFTCDNGIVYYDGEFMCYKEYTGRKIKFIKGNVGYNTYRNGIHYARCNEQFDVCYFIKLLDIYKNYKYNKTIIPIYNLNLYQSNITDILGISAVVKDIIQKQTEIYTKYLTFDD